MQSWHMPVLAPANVAEYLEFGLYGWALSRFSGNWVGFTALSEVVESGSTVDLDETNARVAAWKAGPAVEAETGLVRPADGLHYRWPDLPSLKIEARLHAKLDAVRAFAKVNSIDLTIVAAPLASVGIVPAAGSLDCRSLPPPYPPPGADSAGLSLQVLPLLSGRRRGSCLRRNPRQILVVEGRPGRRDASAAPIYNRPRCVLASSARRTPKAAVVSSSRLKPSADRVVSDWLLTFRRLDRRHCRRLQVPELLSTAGDAVKRVQYVRRLPAQHVDRVPEARAPRRIGCHFMESG